MKRHIRLTSPPKSILIISMRYLGDLLLTTPLIRTLKKAYPNAQIDVLAFSSTKAMLEGNTDIRAIIDSPTRPTANDYKRIIKSIFRKYDLAVSTQTGDRQFIYSLMAASKRVSFVPPKSDKGWWKRFFFQGWTEFNNVDSHMVLEFLRLSELLSAKPHYDLIPPSSTAPALLDQLKLGSDYVVMHVHPQWTYKQWHQQGWIDVGRYIEAKGLKVVLSGGPDKEEQDYIAQLQQNLPKSTLNIAGKVSLAELSHIISQAKLFIGPDTGITHLASASDVPVIAIFGPTNPIKWAPWPKNYARSENPFLLTGCQHVNNVYLVQGHGDCVPCDLEGCDRHRLSRSKCMDSLSAHNVTKLIDSIYSRLGKE